MSESSSKSSITTRVRPRVISVIVMAVALVVHMVKFPQQCVKKLPIALYCPSIVSLFRFIVLLLLAYLRCIVSLLFSNIRIPCCAPECVETVTLALYWGMEENCNGG